MKWTRLITQVAVSLLVVVGRRKCLLIQKTRFPFNNLGHLRCRFDMHFPIEIQIYTTSMVLMLLCCSETKVLRGMCE